MFCVIWFFWKSDTHNYKNIILIHIWYTCSSDDDTDIIVSLLSWISELWSSNIDDTISIKIVLYITYFWNSENFPSSLNFHHKSTSNFRWFQRTKFEMNNTILSKNWFFLCFYGTSSKKMIWKKELENEIHNKHKEIK